MTRIRLLIVCSAIVASAGCTGSRGGPALAGGKPVDEWLRALSNSDPKQREKAVEKLGNVGPGDPAVLSALCGALKDGNSEVRGQAVLAIAKFGAAAKPALEQLRVMGRQDPDPRVRSYAQRALESLDKP
jgi:HEAT repeat protein